MLTVEKTPRHKVESTYTPNLLPCRIHRDGPVNASLRFWNPEIGQDRKPEAFFRGRKLKGREIEVPEGYRGVIVKEEAKPGEGESLRERITTDLDKMEDPIGIKTKILQEVGTFGNVVVWGHETTAETDDVFVKGLGEWINFAESLHEYDHASK